ncbi:FAD-dependent oxidoreductase [Leucobacter soli]|uniref:FAD-dependent oxidoreductase n=1 Tax=Leucobacter soli TaxID=2812850 RepID=UPI0036113FD0
MGTLDHATLTAKEPTCRIHHRYASPCSAAGRPAATWRRRCCAERRRSRSPSSTASSPYGLIRYGVAADHQSTKTITRQFDRLFADPAVRFAGDIEVGRDLGLDELCAAFDVVVLATGLSDDARIGIPGEDLPGIYGSGTITRVLNSHPGERPFLPALGDDVVIIGGGNVAIDLLRFLVKDRSGYIDSDIADHALDAYLSAPAERVTLLNRSAPAAAKSDPQMLKELAALPARGTRPPNSAIRRRSTGIESPPRGSPLSPTSSAPIARTTTVRRSRSASAPPRCASSAKGRSRASRSPRRPAWS